MLTCIAAILPQCLHICVLPVAPLRMGAACRQELSVLIPLASLVCERMNQRVHGYTEGESVAWDQATGAEVFLLNLTGLPPFIPIPWSLTLFSR